MVSTFPDVTAAELTARQRRILEFIRDWVERYGYPPSVREIGEAVGLVSPSSVAYQLKELERKGFLRRDPNRPRAVDVRPPGDLVDDEAARAQRPTPAYVPMLGRIAAGGPILAEQAVEDFFPLPRELVGEGDVFMLAGQGRLDDRRGDLRRRLGGRPPAADGQQRRDRGRDDRRRGDGEDLPARATATSG